MEVIKNVKTLKNYIGGQWVESTSKKIEDVPNPATGELLQMSCFNKRRFRSSCSNC